MSVTSFLAQVFSVASKKSSPHPGSPRFSPLLTLSPLTEYIYPHRVAIMELVLKTEDEQGNPSSTLKHCFQELRQPRTQWRSDGRDESGHSTVAQSWHQTRPHRPGAHRPAACQARLCHHQLCALVSQLCHQKREEHIYTRFTSRCCCEDQST